MTTTLFDLCKQIKNTVEIFSLKPDFYKKEGLSRISSSKSKAQALSVMLMRHSIPIILGHEDASHTDYAHLLIDALKQSFMSVEYSDVSQDHIDILASALGDELIKDKSGDFIEFYHKLCQSKKINDIFLAQSLHDFLHLCFQIAIRSEDNLMPIENCAITFSANIANLLGLKPAKHVNYMGSLQALNDVILTLYPQALFSEPFELNASMRTVLSTRCEVIDNTISEFDNQIIHRRHSVMGLKNEIKVCDISPQKRRGSKDNVKSPRIVLTKGELEVKRLVEEIEALNNFKVKLKHEKTTLCFFLGINMLSIDLPCSIKEELSSSPRGFGLLHMLGLATSPRADNIEETEEEIVFLKPSALKKRQTPPLN